MPEAPDRNQGPPDLKGVRRCPTFPPVPGSIIGAGRLSFRVRDGSGRFPAAVAAVTLFSCGPVFFGGGVGGWLRGSWLRARCGASSRLTLLVFPVWVCVSFRPVSASSLRPLLVLQVWSIDPVVCGGPYPSKRVRSLVLEEVSRLDAFSGYPVRTWLSSRAPGGTTGKPEVRPSRSSRTRDRFPQASDARGG